MNNRFRQIFRQCGAWQLLLLAVNVWVLVHVPIRKHKISLVKQVFFTIEAYVDTSENSWLYKY